MSWKFNQVIDGPMGGKVIADVFSNAMGGQEIVITRRLKEGEVYTPPPPPKPEPSPTEQLQAECDRRRAEVKADLRQYLRSSEAQDLAPEWQQAFRKIAGE